jgi:Ca2+-binding RTX toxin-like protein
MADFEVELNNTRVTANAITSGVDFGGQLLAATDIDVFKITTTGPTTLELSFTSPETVDVGFSDAFIITIFDSATSLTPLVSYSSDLDFSSVLAATAAGTYYIQVQVGPWPDVYKHGQYKLKVTDGSKLAEIEGSAGNNTLVTANNFIAGNTVFGQLATGQDQDFFSFTFANAGLGTVLFTSPVTTEQDPGDSFKISVFDATGVLIVSHTTDLTLPGFNFSVPVAGKYYVSVSAPDNWWASHDYSLSVTATGDVTTNALDDVANSIEDTPLQMAAAELLRNDTGIRGTPVSVTSVQGAVNGSVSLVTNNITFTPTPDFFGLASFTYTITDLDNKTSTATVNVTVAPVNDAPVATNDTFSVEQGAILALPTASLLDNDTGLGDLPIGITSVQDAVNGTVSLESGNITFTPTDSFSGSASFTYTITDLDKEISTATVTVTVVSADKTVTGGPEDNKGLAGGVGDDVINGGAGKDTMLGERGNDTYFVDNKGDKVIEFEGQGTADIVVASININALMSQVENLALAEGSDLKGNLITTGKGNALDNIITGNSNDNKLYGLDGNDVLDGWLGADYMAGGNGDDTFVVDNIKDKVVESANHGEDTILAMIDILKLASNIENISLEQYVIVNAYGGTAHGNNAKNTLTGNNGFNHLDGHGGDDVIFGGGGNDELHGGTGNDDLSGGEGNDTFVFETKLSELNNLDVIDDFHVSTGLDPDKILLNKSVFGRLVKGDLLSENFYGYSGVPSQQGENAYILFDSSTGVLYYDADGGLGSGVPIAFVTVGVVGLTAADIVVV